MNWPASIGLSILSAAGGGLLGLGVGLACVNWYAVSSFEGKSGYMVGFFMLVGVLLGLVIGLAAARMPSAAAAAPFAAFASALLRAVIGLLSCGAAVLLIAWLLAPPAEPASEADPQPVDEPSAPEPDPATWVPAPDAPLAEWLDVLRYNGNPDVVQQVVAHVAKTPDLTDRLGELLQGEDDNAAYGALVALSLLPADVVVETDQLMMTTARDLLSRIESAAARSPETDPRYEAAAGAQLRFAGWVAAFRSRPGTERSALQPLLVQMGKTAATRPDSDSLKEIVRIATHHAAADSAADE